MDENTSNDSIYLTIKVKMPFWEVKVYAAAIITFPLLIKKYFV